MTGTGQILEAMGPEQYFLAFIFIGSYAVAVGELAHARWRRMAALIGFASAVACTALSDPWEQGVILIALAFVGMALFAGLVWGVWAVATRRERQAAALAEAPAATVAAHPVPERPLWARLRASLRFN